MIILLFCETFLKIIMDKQFQFIHTKQIDAISAGDIEFKIELIDIFLEQIPEFISEMNNSYNNGDWDTLAREAHTAKSSALTFGMDETGNLLKIIQEQTENKEIDDLAEIISQAIKQLSAAVSELKELKEMLQSSTKQ